jgi:hypothetical protein
VGLGISTRSQAIFATASRSISFKTFSRSAAALSLLIDFHSTTPANPIFASTPLREAVYIDVK